MVKFDPSEVLQYFSIVEKVATVTAGRHSHIAGEVMARLNAIEEGLVNERRRQRDLPPEPSPMVQAAADNIPPAAVGSDQLVSEPEPSKPIEPPKSSVANDGQSGLKAHRTTIGGVPGPAKADETPAIRRP